MNSLFSAYVNYGYHIDYYYLALVVPALLISAAAQIWVKSAFAKYSKQPTARGMTGSDAAREVLRRSGVMNVGITGVRGNLTDHYDPKANVIRLSENVFGSSSVAAVGVAAHEAGHAVQYSQEYFPVRMRSAIFNVSRIGSSLSLPLIVLGLMFDFAALFLAGIICFVAALLFQLVTLPAELDASKRAITALRESCLLDEEELKGARAVLTAAAFTYIGALLISAAQLMRFLLIFSNRRRD